jgi:hypothetical protein
VNPAASKEKQREGRAGHVTAKATPTAIGSDPAAGLDFLGCELRKAMSGKIWEEHRRRVYFLHRRPSRRSMQRIRDKIRAKTHGGRCHADLRDVIRDLNPILVGWGSYFRTGNAARSFNQIDDFVWQRLRGLRVKRKGRQLHAAEAARWTADFFHALGLHRLRGTVRYPGGFAMSRRKTSSVSRVRENRKHGSKGGLAITRPATGEG